MKKILFFLPLFAMITLLSCGDGIDLKKDKGDKWDKEDTCLELVYPVTYTMPDDTDITGDEEEVWTAIKAWYEANEETEEKPALNYPVDIVWEEEGTTQTVDSEAEMIILKKECDEEWTEEDMPICEWDEATEASGSEFEKYVVDELVVSEDCGCVVSGFEKFLQNGQTRFLIYYKYEDCVGYGYKVTCENGDCKDAVKCKFLQEDCDGE